jgi:hypothetical protein
VAVLEIPTRSDIDTYTFSVDLEGTAYGFAFHFNGRMQKWLMNILAEDGTPILESLPAFVNTDIIGRFSDARLPPGHIIFIDKSGAALDPGLDDLGDRVRMFYIDSTEVI